MTPMPTFKYLAKKGPKELIEGVLDAESRSNVISHLAALGYIPVRISEAMAGMETVSIEQPVVNTGRRVRVPQRHLNQFTRQFASLVRAQVPLLRGLGILKDQTAHAGLQRLLADITEQIRQGQTFSESLAKYPSVFPPLYVSLVRSGEIAGTLDIVMDRLAVQADRDEALRAKLQAALAYPLFVGLVGVGTVVFLLTFVMPRLVKLFQGFGSRLPLPTRILLGMTKTAQQPLTWAILVVVGIATTLIVRSRGAAYRRMIDRVSLRVPLLGGLVRCLELSRFTRSFGLVLEHGIPILQAVDVARPVVGNAVVRGELDRLPSQLKEGGSLAASMKGLTIMTPMALNMIAVGEEGGRVAEALVEIANYYEHDLERRLQTMAALLEPAMILVVGSVVGFIVMAVLLPIFEMSVIAR